MLPEGALESEWSFLFERSPIPSLLQDWTEVLAWIDALPQDAEFDLGEYLDAQPEVVFEVVGRVRILAANEAYLRFDGSPGPEAVAGSFPQQSIAEGWQMFRDHLVDLWRGEPQSEVEFGTVTRSGRHITVVVRYAHHPTEPGIRLVTVQDVTELRRAQAVTEATAESHDQFVASVAHELRTPLTAVVGFATELEARFETLSDPERQELIQLLARESREVAAIVEDLLVATRAGEGDLTMARIAVDLTQLVREVVLVMRADVEFGHVEAISACADPTRVRQIVRNLITNAERYGGPNRRLLMTQGEGVACIEVRDDGPELSPEVMDRIFAPYAREPRSRPIPGSVGLGLAVARQLAEAMGGRLSAFRDGAETVFELSLPAGPCPDQSDN